MIEWERGGWTGSLNKWVRLEVAEQLSQNSAARRARYGIAERTVRRFFGIGSFGRFVALYLCLDVVLVVLEACVSLLAPDLLPKWAAPGPAPAPDIKALLLNVSSYLLGAQVSLLGVISLALALVTLIAQREGSSTDVQVYYHESLAFELVASCLALLAVLCVQLLWPLQFVLHQLGFGTNNQIFKVILLGVHLAWLVMNIGTVAYFIATTFRFVQDSAREKLRERYTANIVQPRDMTVRLREQLYGLATKELIGDELDERRRPSAIFGFDYGDPQQVEIRSTFRRPTVLYDVRMIWVRWVLRRWASRCVKAAAAEPGPSAPGLMDRGPRIWFTPHIDSAMRGEVGWCRRRGGVSLSRLEKIVLRRAFIFRRARDDA